VSFVVLGASGLPAASVARWQGIKKARQSEPAGVAVNGRLNGFGLHHFKPTHFSLAFPPGWCFRPARVRPAVNVDACQRQTEAFIRRRIAEE
jgi:hypothetical protein